MLLIDIRSTNASAAELIVDRLKLYLAGRHHHHTKGIPVFSHLIKSASIQLLNTYIIHGTKNLDKQLVLCGALCGASE